MIMLVIHYIQLLILEATVINASPAWIYNTGLGNTNPSGVGCTSFTKQFDPYTGRVQYRCNPNIVSNSQYVGLTIAAARNGATAATGKASSTTRSLAFQGGSGRSRSGSPQPKDTLRASPRSQAYARSRFTRRCPPGQIFVSELNICISEEIANRPPLPPRPSRPSSSSGRSRLLTLDPFDRLVGDAPPAVRTPASPSTSGRARLLTLNPFDRLMGDAPPAARTPASSIRLVTPPRPFTMTALPATVRHVNPYQPWSIISVGKFDVKKRCQPHEILVSELDICLPINNCYPYSETC